MARLYGYGSDPSIPQEPVELDRTSALPPAEDTRTNPSYVVSADLFKTQRMHIGNFPQRESEITLSIVDIQTKSTTNQTMIHIGGITTFGANSLNLVGMDFAMQWNVNSKTSCTVEFLKIGDVSAANIIGSGTLTEVSMIQIHDPTTLAANITTTVGLDIQDINSALTNNFAIRTGTGLVELGEDVHIHGDLTVDGSSPSATVTSPLTLAETDSPGELLLLRNDTGVIADEVLGILSFQGDEGSDLTTVVKIEGIAAETWDGSNHAAYLAFSSMNTSDSLAERMRLTSQGKLLIGSATTQATDSTLLELGNAFGPHIVMWRDDASIADGNNLAAIDFAGDEGSDFYITATIQALAAEAWDATGKSSDLLFFTTPVGTEAIAEHMRITSEGEVLIANTTAISGVVMQIGTAAPDLTFNKTAAAIVNDSLIGRLRWFADDDSSGEGQELAAVFQYIATGTWDSTNAPAKLSWQLKTTADLISEAMFIDETHKLNIPGLTASSDVQTDGSSFLITVSDERLKTDKSPLDIEVMPRIMDITPSYFRFKHEPRAPLQLGFLAQNVHEQFPEAAPKSKGKDPKDGTEIIDLHGFNSRAMLAVVVKGIQELNERLELLEEV